MWTTQNARGFTLGGGRGQTKVPFWGEEGVWMERVSVKLRLC